MLVGYFIICALILLSVIAWQARSIFNLKKNIKARLEENQLLQKRGSEFVANVSHELKTPLTSIKGYSETLKTAIHRDPQKAIEFVSRIDENAERLSLLITDILELSRIEAPTFHHSIEIFKVDPVIRALKDEFTLKLTAKEQTLLIRNEVENLSADRRMFEHALTNLIENAHRYSGLGAVIEIAGLVTNENGRDWAQFSVLDNGPGINPEDLPRIFERFYRADKSRARAGGGTGLGLAIVKHILISHGGHVKAESEQGKGARFTLSFPI